MAGRAVAGEQRLHVGVERERDVRGCSRRGGRQALHAQHAGTVFGQLWLVLNPLLLAGVYFVLVDILRGVQPRIRSAR